MELWQVIAGIVVLAVVGLVLFLSRRRKQPAKVDLAQRLATPRRGFGEALRNVFTRQRINDEFWFSLEEGLVALDLGVSTANAFVSKIKATAPADADGVRRQLQVMLAGAFAGKERSLHLPGRPAVVLVVGVNGTGKTTTIAKLAAHLQTEGRTALLGAADTFRAGADTQLRTWADRVGVEVVGGQGGGDPAAVAFDAYQAAKARGRDVVLIDTAGRLHSKQNLMAELGKVVRVLNREAGQLDEVLLVLDASTGQNGVAQVKVFTEAVGVTGIVLTKVDGTAKGGIVVAVEQELGVPVKFIGVGEGVEDLLPFQPEDFVQALMTSL